MVLSEIKPIWNITNFLSADRYTLQQCNATELKSYHRTKIDFIPKCSACFRSVKIWITFPFSIVLPWLMTGVLFKVPFWAFFSIILKYTGQFSQTNITTVTSQYSKSLDPIHHKILLTQPKQSIWLVCVYINNQYCYSRFYNHSHINLMKKSKTKSMSTVNRKNWVYKHHVS